MPSGRGRWRVVLGAEAEADLARIRDWTAERFGDDPAAAYAARLARLIVRLFDGPQCPGSVARGELGPGLRTLHLRAVGERGSHFLLYVARDREVVVIRVLHESMDLDRHLPDLGRDGDPRR